MAEKLGEALLDLNTDDKKFNQGVDRAEKRATGLGRTLDGTSRRAVALGKALGTAAAVGVTAFAAGIVGAVKRLEEMRKAGAQVDQALKNSGNTARTSAREIEAWADKLETRTGRAAEEVMAVSANLASFGFGREQFFRAITLADDMSAAWGGDLRQNLEGLSRALDDPINGMAMLSKRGVKLTEDQKELAKSFLDAGDKARAQGVVFDALEAQVKGVAEAGFGGLTAALAKARKAWEDAFEDLVTGKGDASDLRDTLVELADTVSSPEFIRSVMGFGEKLAEGVNLAAQAVIGAWNMMKDFLAWLDARKPENVATGDIEAQIADLTRWRDQAQAQADKGGFEVLGLVGMNAANRAKGYQDQIDALQAELAFRGRKFDKPGDGLGSFADFKDELGIFPPVEGNTDPYGGGGGGSSDAAKEAEKHAKAVRDLIADLEHERDIVGLSTRDQEIMTTVRRAGVDAMSEEGLKIRALITETEDHRDQLERMQDVYELMGNVGQSAIQGIADAMKDGKVEGEELLSILGDVVSMVAQAALTQGLSGIGGNASGIGSALSSMLFSGFHANGGLIPSGSFGIVGEEGPEPVIATSSGAHVLPNSSLAGLGGAEINVTIVKGADEDRVEQRRNSNGSIDITAFVKTTVGEGLASGDFDGALAGSFGLRRKGR